MPFDIQPNLKGDRYNREMKRLLLAHAFKFVGRVVFYVGENNLRSQRAMEKIGAVRKGMVERPASVDVVYVVEV
jgi:RimJ/RimL family protein N-acetyltransferase